MLMKKKMSAGHLGIKMLVKFIPDLTLEQEKKIADHFDSIFSWYLIMEVSKVGYFFFNLQQKWESFAKSHAKIWTRRHLPRKKGKDRRWRCFSKRDFNVRTKFFSKVRWSYDLWIQMGLVYITAQTQTFFVSNSLNTKL